jgi:hypothetical protein
MNYRQWVVDVILVQTPSRWWKPLLGACLHSPTTNY